MENYSYKYNSQLQLDIQDNSRQIVEVIVKFSGDIVAEVGQTGVVEILSENYAIITLPFENIPILAQLDTIEYIEQSKDMFFMENSNLSQSCIFREESYRSGKLSGKGVFIGIIDSGINPIAFVNENGSSMVRYIWDLSLEGNPPTGFNIGSEFISENINGFSGDTIGHGSAVAGIAGGNPIGIAYNSELIIVKLNSRNGFARSTEIMRGIKYIIDKAIENNKPVAINISYGTNDGSHDGFTLFEEYINSMADKWKTSIIVATGNEGDASHHFATEISDGEIKTAEFNIALNTASVYLSLWKGFADEIQLRLIAPDGQSSATLNSTGGQYFFSIGNSRVNVLFGQPTPYSSSTEIYFRIQGDYIQSGIWQLEITGVNIVEGKVDVWLPVKEGQSEDTRFLNPDINTTLTIPSAALKVIAVGGYNSQVDTGLSFSGRGYTRLYNVVKPDIVAPAYEIRTVSADGGYIFVTGTSFAAPHVTGAVALLMEWGIVQGNDPYLYGERVKAYLQYGAERDAGVIYPNTQWGYGRLCLEDTLKALERLSNISAMELNNNIEEKIYSDDFVDIVLENNGELEKIPANLNDAFVHLIENQYAIAYVRRDVALNYIGEFLNNTLAFEPYLMGLMDLQSLESSGILRVQTQPNLSLRGSGTVVAVIDTGIDYRNTEFIYEDNTTKIISVWDQSIPGAPPEGQYYGTEFTMEEINSALAENVSLPTNDTLGHGTRLAEISGGRSGVAPDSQLIVVKLKPAKEYLRQVHLLPDNAVAFQSSDVITAIDYVYNKARQLGRPVSICIGVGTSQGGHTGYSIMERYISDIATRQGVCISVPVGNEAIAQHHTVVELSDGNSVAEVEISVGENEKGFPLWIWNYITDSVAVEIVSPLGSVISRIQPQMNFSNEYNLTLEGTQVFVMYIRPLVYSQDQLTVLRLENPVAGVWRIRLYGENILEGRVHLWLPISGFIGEDSFFLTPAVETTLTAPSNAVNVLSVGGWNVIDNSVYAGSGRGPTRINVVKPVILAPAVNVNGFTGTSAATAVVAGAATLMLEWGVVKGNNEAMNTTVISSYLIRGAVKSEGAVYPNNISGYGVLDLYESFRRIL